MASQPNPSDRSRFAKLGMAVHEELTQACRDVIEMDVSPALVHNKVKGSSIYEILRPKQKLRLLRAKNEGYKEFDITLLYTLVRNISSTIPLPTKGKWGGNTMPTVGEITIGDDIERIRWIRNNILGHISSASYISQKEFDNTWSSMTDICHRLQTYTKKDYMFGMSNIQRQALEEEIENAIIEKLEEDYRYNLSLMEMLSSEEQHVLELTSKSDKKVLIQGTNNMASRPNPSNRSRFAKLGMAVHEELTQACRDVIEMDVSPALVHNKVKGSSIYEILRPKQKLRLLRAKNEGYKEFDITLLYTLIRNISSTIPLPTKGKWGGNTMPTVGEITIGDDIERIRWIRNNILGHISSASYISQKEFYNTWSTMTGICHRLQIYTKKDYMFGMNNIQRQALEEEIENAIIEKLEEDYRYNLSLMEMMSSEEQHVLELTSKSDKKGYQKMEHNIACEEDLVLCRLAEVEEQLGKKSKKEEQYLFDIIKFIFQNRCILFCGIPLNVHIVGSSAEGVLILNPSTKRTDVDLMFVLSLFQAYERRKILEKKDKIILKMDCKGAVPGYAFLTNTTDNVHFPSSDLLTLSLSLMNIDLPLQQFFSLVGAPRISNGYLNGPSLAMEFLTQGNIFTSSFPSFIKSCDRVFAIKCDEWPEIADEWMQRERRYSWPSGEIIEKAIELGCHLVPVGKDDKCEWRISFVLAEKLLVRNMNPMQHFVYSFLKSIKEEIFSSARFGITSYVLKTVVFWVSEENDVSKWRPSTVLQHVRLCFLKLTEFLCSGRCPHYFMKSCDLFYKKMSHLQIVKLIARLRKLTNSGNFKSVIINLKSVKLLKKNMILQDMQIFRLFMTFLEIWSPSYEKLLSRVCNELAQPFVETLFNIEDLKSPEQMMMTIANVLTKVKTEDNDLPVSFKDTLIRILSCMQIRAKCAVQFQTVTESNSAKTIDEKIQLVNHLIEQSKLQVETLCPGDSTQIAHAFFSLGCYEDCLKIISPMLEAMNTKFQPGIGSYMALSQVQISISMSKENDVSSASPLRPILHIEFFPFEVQMLTKDLKLEIVTLEIQNTILRKSFPMLKFFPAVQVKLNINSLVYALYLKFQCYRFLGNYTGSCSALEDFKNASSRILDNAISLNLLGCCLKENGQLEEGIRNFGRSVQKNRELLGTKYQIAILLKHAFNSF